MGMTAFYVQNAAEHEEEALKTIERALELGCNHFDTAYVYNSVDEHGVQHWNESLLGKAIARFGREKFIISTKFGIDRSRIARGFSAYCSSEDVILQQLGDSLARLGTDYVDLYYQHRQDPDVPIETVARVLDGLRVAGRIRYIGFSEITADELRRAAAVCPVTAIQMEYSIASREIEANILPTARELGVAVVAYSPLGRGILSKKFTDKDQLFAGDSRVANARAHVKENFETAKRLEAIANTLSLPPATLALAWVLAQGLDVFPIPGCKAVQRLEQNLSAVHVALSADTLRLLGEIPAFIGERYRPGMQSFEEREKKL